MLVFIRIVVFPLQHMTSPSHSNVKWRWKSAAKNKTSTESTIIILYDHIDIDIGT